MIRGISFIGAILALSLPLVGCGGGGGKSKGSSGSGMVTLSLVGTPGSASGPTGTSQHIVVYRNDGTVVDEKTVDVSSGTTQVNLTNLPSGTLRLHFGLLASAGASEVGAIDTLVQGGTALPPMEIAMAQPVSSVVVAPASGSVSVGSNLPLYAAAKTTAGSYVYTAPSGWSWRSDAPSIATIDASGTVTGVGQGTADITAVHVASNASTLTTVGVLPNGIRHGKWTVMVYMNAANSLYQEAVDNVNQMERIANNPDVRFVIQWKQVRGLDGSNNAALFTGTRRYLASYDAGGSSQIKSLVVQDFEQLGQTIDMGSPAALSDFVSWSKTNYPADHYALVMWDHGSGWFDPRSIVLKSRVISTDDQTGNALQPSGLRAALAPYHFDILAYDACLMQGAEDLLEMPNVADYVIGSEDNTPGPGYPYNRVFKPFVDNPDDAVPTLAKSFVTQYQSYYAQPVGTYDYSVWTLHQSVLDMSKIPTLQAAIDNFGSTLVANSASLGNLMSTVRTNSTLIEDGYGYYDLDQVCAQTASRTTNANVAAAASAVRSALSDMTVLSQGNSAGSFMKGLSIEFSSSNNFNSGNHASQYRNLMMADQTHWDEFLSSTVANP